MLCAWPSGNDLVFFLILRSLDRFNQVVTYFFSFHLKLIRIKHLDSMCMYLICWIKKNLFNFEYEHVQCIQYILMEGITNQYTCTCITAFIHRDLCFHFSMPISWIYDKSLVTNAIIKSGCRFRKSCFDKYRRLFLVTGTFRSSTGVGEKWEKALIYL